VSGWPKEVMPYRQPELLAAAADIMVLICEGPSDTAALLDLGFSAVGRPSCNGGRKLLVELVQQRKPSSIVIVSDNDSPGQRGAVLKALRSVVPTIGVMRFLTAARRRLTITGAATAKQAC
jgi:5S rRNA maturation endonuclease (ribonuclease M5)